MNSNIQYSLNAWLSVTAIFIFSGCAVTGTTTNQSQTTAFKSTFEQDRKAILAMSGEYSVSFKFMETATFRANYELKKPYTSAAKEIVEVIEDSGKRIDMQHILLAGPRVVKHWRQTWIYEPEFIYEFKGHKTWVPRKLSSAESKGAWAQIVSQVDDSPRYASVARWSHVQNRSTWEAQAWRPLPRREYTTRSDYHVLVARNRHTITPTGWLHEQDNYKLVLGQKENAIIAQEIGFNIYDRTSSVDFTKVRDYWAATNVFWNDVRGIWSGVMDGSKTLKLKKTWKNLKLFQHLFSQARKAGKAPAERDAYKAKAQEIIKAFMVVDSSS